MAVIDTIQWVSIERYDCSMWYHCSMSPHLTVASLVFLCTKGLSTTNFVKLNEICLSSKNKNTKNTSSVLNGQYQNGWNTDQNQTKNICSFFSSFEDSSHENLLDTGTRLLFLVVFISFYISGYDFSQVLELR